MAAAITDMALMAMMPFIARFVWLLTDKRSPETLTTVSQPASRIAWDKVRLLIGGIECCINEVIRPVFQERILQKSVSSHQRQVKRREPPTYFWMEVPLP